MSNIIYTKMKYFLKPMLFVFFKTLPNVKFCIYKSTN
jgi:hypothetical protein